jgi:hypothetical protein
MSFSPDFRVDILLLTVSERPVQAIGGAGEAPPGFGRGRAGPTGPNPCLTENSGHEYLTHLNTETKRIRNVAISLPKQFRDCHDCMIFPSTSELDEQFEISYGTL